MHNLQPNTHYRIVTVRLAVPADISDGEVADGLNEMLRPAMTCQDAVLHDYAIDGLGQAGTVVTTNSPEEGELFQ